MRCYTVRVEFETQAPIVLTIMAESAPVAVDQAIRRFPACIGASIEGLE